MPVPLSEIGPYHIVRALGQGGMGAVWLATDTRLGRHVALKFVAGLEGARDDARLQQLREARAAAALAHQNIAAVHDVLDVDGQVVIVFEYVDGPTLAARVARGPLAVDEAVAIASQLAAALAAAHAHGVVHRDLKPANIVIAADDVVKVLDFGVARIMPEGADSATRAQTTVAGFVGTVGYAAPEQYFGQGADARADIFSLGVVLFEMLAGRRPFSGDHATAIVRSMTHAPAPRLSTIARHVPAALDTLVARMLATDPAGRPSSAREVRRELQALQSSTSSPAPVPQPRRPWAVAALVTVALTVGGLVTSLSVGRPASPVNKPPVVAVLPLANVSDDPAKDYLTVGVADSLVTRLAGLPDVTVLSRAAVAEARRTQPDFARLASELDASYLVDGSVQEVGNRIRITLSLVRRDASVAWADTVEGTFESVFELQTRLASALAQGLAVQLSAADRSSIAQQPTMNPAALAAYWRGRTLLERRDVEGNLEAALAAFDAAIAHDARFAEAHAARGQAFWSKYLVSRDPDDAQAALQAGTTALRLKPNSAEVRHALAVTLAGTGQLDAAVEELQRALALRPLFEDARVDLARTLARQGKIDEAIREYQRVTDVRPNYAPTFSAMGLSLFQAGRYRAAADAFETVVRLQPDNAVALQQAGVAYHSLGELDRALEFYRRALRIRPYAQAYSNIGAIHHQRGEYDAAVENYQRALALRPNARETHRNLGDAYARLGRRDAARRAYREAVRLADADLKVNPHDARILASLAVYLQKAGDRVAAQQRLAAALATAPADFEVLRRAAQVHALAGDPEAALRALKAALSSGLPRELAAADDELESLRTLPEYAALMESARP